ncbi:MULTISPECIES: twin-arginine translocase TatA/TatE family subunit [unclassified Leucobacter]|uniref:twin-arginine translocase TatA/TatE family subunit n=1 Tax=unclassified Leucobacter TaxID=2621730 RepID=UPI00301813A5
MFGNLSGPTLVVILFIVLLLFGAPKLPGLAKSLGQSMRILKKEVRNDDAAEKGSDGAPESPSSEGGSNTARPEPREGGNTAPGDKP